MKRFKSIIVFLAVVLLFSGCDWLRSTLGMPNSQDLARMQTEIRMRRITDSLDALVKDTIFLGDTLNRKNSMPDSVSVALTNIDTVKKQATTTTTQIKAPVTAPKEATSQISARFYVIVGSFKDDGNVVKMDGYLSKNGYKPIHLNFKNGYKVVASGAFLNANEAYTAMKKLLSLDFSPEDVWVYDTNQKLHIN